ncbi:MAG: HTH domain-containing protein [Planctomycetota bacterium]
MCGHTVLYTARSKRIVRILEVLNQRTRVGAWVAKSGPELASELGGSAGEAAVVSAIYNFRKALTDVLRTQVGIEADNQTIVCSGGTGYRFSDLVTVRDARNTVAIQAPEVETPANRRELILTLLRQSGKMRSTNIASELGCSLKTVKRELDTLRLAGHIEFVGPSKTGTYRLVGA